MPDPPPRSPHLPAPPRWGIRVDVLSASLVIAFAFVAASFVARNTDVWLHLATGRLLASGEYRFGADPFAFSTGGRYWVNHAWLFDLTLYLTFQSLGAPAVVALKAVAVGSTAGLMLSLSRSRGPKWIAAGCVLLAVLAMSHRLLLQPATASLALLAGCVCLLRAGGRCYRAVPVLTAVWVNVDVWFVFGPALVALFWVGRRLNPQREALPPWPGWLLPATLGACLLSPHHVFTLQLPAELSPAVDGSAFRFDPRFAGMFASPWPWGPLGAAGGYSPAAWAYFGLVAVGLVSFAANRRALRCWRAPVWLALAVLAACQVRLIPFFAVVAGPIAALNWGEVWPAGAFTRCGRGLVFGAAVALLGLGWMGWLNGVNARDRGVAWGVHSDSTLARTAVGVAEWRRASGLPPEARVLATHPDVGNYLAWHASGERTFLDSRLSLFTPDAEAFATLSRNCGILPPGGDSSLPQNVAAVVLYDPDPARMTHALAAVAASRWAVVRVDGAAVVLVARGAAGAGLAFDPERASFGGESELAIAWAGPSRLTESAPWWRVRGSHGRTGSWEADAATVYLRLAESAPPSSPAPLLLAIRAGRVGVEVDATDPTAWLALGRAYTVLGERTWEREAGADLTLLSHIRLFQAIGTLTQAVLLNPDAAATHQSLARLFFRHNALDLARHHATRAAQLVRRAGPSSGEADEAFAERAAQLEALADACGDAVQDAQNRYVVRTAGLTGEPLARARVAAELGLVQQAIEILISSHPDLYGPVGVGLLAELLLRAGQVAECRTLLDRSELLRNPLALGYHTLARKPHPDGTRSEYRLRAYDWLDLCQCATAGRYSAASEAVGRITDSLAADERVAAPLSLGTAALLSGDIGLAVPPNPLLGRLWRAREQIGLRSLLRQAQTLPVTRADMLTLAGVLELERGDRRSAAAKFAVALELYGAVPGRAVTKPGEPLAGRYHKALQTAR